MNIKGLILGVAGLLAIAFALVFGEFNFSRGIFFYAPFLYIGGSVCIAFSALIWWLDVPRSSPKMARDFMTLFYEPAKGGAESALLFEDSDGWWKFMTNIDGDDIEEFAAVYDRSERKCLEASIREFLEDPEKPGFLKEKYLPPEIRSISFNIDEDNEMIFMMERKPEFAAPAVIDYGEDELVDDSEDF